jgi:hypothetical protein
MVYPPVLSRPSTVVGFGNGLDAAPDWDVPDSTKRSSRSSMGSIKYDELFAAACSSCIHLTYTTHDTCTTMSSADTKSLHIGGSLYRPPEPCALFVGDLDPRTLTEAAIRVAERCAFPRCRQPV